MYIHIRIQSAIETTKEIVGENRTSKIIQKLLLRYKEAG